MPLKLISQTSDLCYRIFYMEYVPVVKGTEPFYGGC